MQEDTTHESGVGLSHNNILVQDIYWSKIYLQTPRNQMNPSEISLCVLPIQEIDSTATKVHGLSVSYMAGQKALVDEDCKSLPTSCLQKAAEEVAQFLH